jgi:hypothetical protein
LRTIGLPKFEQPRAVRAIALRIEIEGQMRL